MFSPAVRKLFASHQVPVHVMLIAKTRNGSMWVDQVVLNPLPDNPLALISDQGLQGLSALG